MHRPVAPHDAIWLQDTATNLMVINGIFTTDRVDLATVQQSFLRRVIEAESGRYARFTRRVERVGNRWYWVDDPAFDISRHIIPAGDPDVGTTEKLRRFVGMEASKPLPPDRPLWQFQVVENFEEGGSAIVIRLHHCIGDGVSLVSVIFHFLQEPGASVAPGAEPGRILPTAGAPSSRLLKLIQMPLAAPGILIRRMLWIPDRHALHGPKLSGRKQVGWTAPFDLQLFKDVKNRFGATVNDVLMACVSGAFSRYIQERAGQVVKKVRISMPVNIRRAGAPLTLENRFAAVPLELPAGIPQIRDRVLAVKQRMDALKQSVAPIVIYGIQSALLTVLPYAASRGLIDFLANKCTAVVTNVPGPQCALTLAGFRVRSMMFWVPQRADIGLGVSVLSFAGKVQVGVICDDQVVADPMELVRAFEQEIEALKAV
jgi:WS/DGAT/MGAT family acyltransferase